MSASKNKTKTAAVSSITLTEEHLKLPEAKALLKKVEELKKRKEIEEKLTPILEFAGKTLEKEFKTFNDLVRYVSKKSENVTRAKKLTESQKNKIDEMKGQKKTHTEIAAAVGCKTSQVNAYVYNKK